MERPKVYVDSNIFLYMLLGTGEKHAASRSFLKMVKEGKFSAFTAALTYDEVFWKVKQMRSYKDALHASKLFLNLPNLKFLAVNSQTIWMANELQSKYILMPRDAIHAAAAVLHGIQTIISDDRDFDKIKELKRRKL